MKILDERQYFISFLSLIFNCIENKFELYIKEKNKDNFSKIKNYFIFFMILFLNVNESSLFIQTVFEKGTNFFNSLIKLIQKLEKKDANFFYKILNNLFLDDYKSLYFKKNTSEKDEYLEEIFINNQLYLSEFYNDFDDGYGLKEYNNLLYKITKFQFSYENFFKGMNLDSINEKSKYKLNIAQSIIRIIFSKEKSPFLDNIKEENKYFEYNFIKNLFDTNLELTKKKYGNDISVLFRKEELIDDLIKYLFYIFGNNMMIESFVKPVEKMLKKLGLDEESIENNIMVALDLPLVRDINKEEFEILIKEINENLNKTIPMVLKIILKLLHISVIKHYNIDKDNFRSIYTALIFNYIVNPKIQELYGINPMKILLVRSLNRLIKNTCFNYKFNENDDLNKFNDLIEKYHISMKNLIIENIINIDENSEKIKQYLSQLFTEKYLLYPKFLFYSDCALISRTINAGSDELINFRQL